MVSSRWRVGGDVDGLDVGEGRQHHQHFGGFEHPRVVLHVAVVHLDVGLGEEAEDLRQQVALGVLQVAVPVLDVVGQRHLLRQPVDALLGEPGLVGPGIAERLVDRVLGQQVEADRVFVGGLFVGAPGRAVHAANPPWLDWADVNIGAGRGERLQFGFGHNMWGVTRRGLPRLVG